MGSGGGGGFITLTPCVPRYAPHNEYLWHFAVHDPAPRGDLVPLVPKVPCEIKVARVEIAPAARLANQGEAVGLVGILLRWRGVLKLFVINGVMENFKTYPH